MPVFVGLVTYLALSATPGLPPATDYAKGEDVSARPNDGTFTGLMLGGVPGRSYGTFAAKTEATEDSRPVTDRYVPVVTFSSVDTIDLDVTDRYVPVLGMSAFGGYAASGIDTYRPVLVMGIGGLEKANVTGTYPVADSYVPTLAMSATVREVRAVTDSYVPVLTLSASLSSSDELLPTDTYVPVLGMSYLLGAVVGTRTLALTDTYVPVLGLSAAAAPAGEVDEIEIVERTYWSCEITEI